MSSDVAKVSLSVTPQLTTPAVDRGGNRRDGKAPGPSFHETLRQLSDRSSSEVAEKPNLKFSHHAIERMRLRGMRFSPEKMQKIEKAVDKAAAKGSQETLLLDDESALIVSVANRTVVTVMDKNSLKDNVFTKIDSTVVL